MKANTVISVVLPVIAGVAMGGTWPVACHDLQRSGVADSEGPCTGEIAWSVGLDGSVDGSPIVTGERIYVGCSTGEMFALRRDDGSVLWSYSSGGAIPGAAIEHEGRIYFGSTDTFVYAVDAATGQLEWRHRTERPVIAALARADDRIIFGSMDGSMRAVDEADGRVVWQQSSGAGISGGIAVWDGCIYYGDEGGNVYARRAATGETVWKGKLSGRVVGMPSIIDDRLYVPLMGHSALTPPRTEFLTGFEIDDGTKSWVAEKPSGRSVFASPVRYEDTIWGFCVEGYVSSGVLRGFNVETGKEVIEQKMGRLVVDADLAIAGDNVFVAGQNGVVYFVNALDGSVEKEVRLGGKIYSSPAIADERLFVGCQDGKLYCIE